MKTRHLLLGLGGAMFVGAATALALTPAELQNLFDNGESATIVDVRSATLFQKGHVPGAINVPAALVPQKQLPPLGRVVVCDDGCGPDLATTAAAALNQKPGIHAEVLTGGFAGWEAARGNSTQAPGVKPEEILMITYRDLKKTPAESTVLVDLRKPAETGAAFAKTALPGAAALAGSSAPLTDLQSEFPNTRITRSPFNLQTPSLSVGAASVPPLLVLIDAGDGSAQATARTLKANGVTRVAILVGGEEILKRKGEPGLERRSVPLLTVPSAALNGLTNQP